MTARPACAGSPRSRTVPVRPTYRSSTYGSGSPVCPPSGWKSIRRWHPSRVTWSSTRTADSFLDTTLGAVLAERAVRRLIVTGYASDFCVDSTSRSALSHGYDVVLVADGHTTMQRPAGTGPTAAQIMAHHNGIFSIIEYAGRSVTVTPAAEVRFE